MCCHNVTPFTTKCWTAFSDEPAPRTTKRPNYRAIYVFVRGFKWALVSRGSHIGEVRHSIWKGSFITEQPIPLSDEHPRRKKWQKKEEIKNDNFVLYNSLAEPACLAALRSAAACVSGIVLEGGVQKQQGAEDKQAIRDSLNTATVASTVEGCEDPRSNRAINPPCTSWSRHLSAARRTTPRHRLSATSHIWVAGHSHFQTPYTYITGLIGSHGTRRSTDRLHVGKLLRAEPWREETQVSLSAIPEVNSCHFVILLWAAGWQFGLEGRLLTVAHNTKAKKGHQIQNNNLLPGQELKSR